MKKDIKELWINALLSGDYKQGKGYLCRIENDEEVHCCLGVLCELAPEDVVTDKVKDEKDLTVFAFTGADKDDAWNTAGLPNSVQEWAGIDGLGEYNHRNLAQDNDEGKSFAYIASIIKREF